MKFFKLSGVSPQSYNPSRRLLPLFALVLLISPARAQPAETPPVADAPAIAAPAPRPVPSPRAPRRVPPPRPTEPTAQIELDLRAFFEAINGLSADNSSYDYRLASYLSGSRIGIYGFSEWEAQFLKERGDSQFRLDQVRFEKLEPGAARVVVSYVQLLPNDSPLAGTTPDRPKIFSFNYDETLDMKREVLTNGGGEKWRIVPVSFETVKNSRPDWLQRIAFFGAQREGMIWQLRALNTQRRLKTLGLGFVQFLQDWDGEFRLDSEFWREAVTPYVGKDANFLVPGTQNFYSFNDHLSNRKLADIKPAQTVLLYEGEDEKPLFHYDGQAIICFADGRVKLVSPDEAKNLIWQP